MEGVAEARIEELRSDRAVVFSNSGTPGDAADARRAHRSVAVRPRGRKGLARESMAISSIGSIDCGTSEGGRRAEAAPEAVR